MSDTSMPSLATAPAQAWAATAAPALGLALVALVAGRAVGRL